MPRLLYGVDRQLRDGERVLAGYLEDGPYGCIVVDGVAYAIQHRGRSGWHFRLLDARGECVCQYDPYPLVRGGRLRGRWAVVSLRGAALRARRFTFGGEPGWRLHAEIRATHRLRTVGEGMVTFESGHEVVLDGELAMRTPEVTLALAFGCWILVERESLPAAGGGG
jgi:hypothetical protein